jgi:hypothetical protein
MHRMMIACAAAAMLAALPAVAMARGGGGHGGGGHGGGGHGGGMGHGGGVGHGGGFAFGGGRAIGFAGVHPGFGHGFHGRHVFVRNRFAFIGGGGYPYGYSSCYTRVWTTWGWTWMNVCY